MHRSFPVFLGLTILTSLVNGQQQEDKFVDRLLRPNLTLENSQQNKKFVAAEGALAVRTFEAKSFSGTKERPTKGFVGIRDFFLRNLGTKKFSRSDWAANAASSAPPSFAHAVAHSKESSLIQEAPEADKTVQTREYPDNRPFLGKGTRQKILSQQDHPLSIEQVRELLNKEKSPTESQ